MINLNLYGKKQKNGDKILNRSFKKSIDIRIKKHTFSSIEKNIYKKVSLNTIF